MCHSTILSLNEPEVTPITGSHASHPRRTSCHVNWERDDYASGYDSDGQGTKKIGVSGVKYRVIHPLFLPIVSVFGGMVQKRQ